MIVRFLFPIAVLLIVSCGEGEECPQKVGSTVFVELPVYEELSLDDLIAGSDLIVTGTAGAPEPRNVRMRIPGGPRTHCRWMIVFDVVDHEVLEGPVRDAPTVLVLALPNATSKQVRAYDIVIEQGDQLLLFLSKLEGDLGYQAGSPQHVWRLKGEVAEPPWDHLPTLPLNDLRQLVQESAGKRGR